MAVAANQAAFEWGRRIAHDEGAVRRLLQPVQGVELRPQQKLEALIRARVEHLTAYQNAAYAARYEAFVRRVQERETALGTGSTALTEAVVEHLAQLMAYKDEYEVARLYTDGLFLAKLREQFDGDFTLHFHLAPPLLSKRNEQGEVVKRQFDPWLLPLMRLLARLKGLRGTWLDPFGHTEERRTERALIREYEAAIEEVLATLTAERLPLALAIARWPARVKGFGHVKARHLAAARPVWERSCAVGAQTPPWNSHQPHARTDPIPTNQCTTGALEQKRALMRPFCPWVSRDQNLWRIPKLKPL